MVVIVVVIGTFITSHPTVPCEKVIFKKGYSLRVFKPPRHDLTVSQVLAIDQTFFIIAKLEAYLPTHCLPLKRYPFMQSHKCEPLMLLQN